MFIVNMLSVITKSVIMLSVTAPIGQVPQKICQKSVDKYKFDIFNFDFFRPKIFKDKTKGWTNISEQLVSIIVVLFLLFSAPQHSA